MSMVCVHCFVTGSVQGVYFRQATQQYALNLGISGWVRNLDDGRVELVACGEQNHIDSLCKWLWHGPDAATVDHVDFNEVDWQQFKGFVIK